MLGERGNRTSQESKMPEIGARRIDGKEVPVEAASGSAVLDTTFLEL